jgi:hypothetical protein
VVASWWIINRKESGVSSWALLDVISRHLRGGT